MVLTTNFLSDVKTEVKQEVIDQFLYGAVGDDDTTPTASDTTLGNETFRKARQDYTNLANNVFISLFLSTSENNGEDIKECGFFDASSSGNLKQRAVTTTIAKTADKEVWFDAKINVSVTQS